MTAETWAIDADGDWSAGTNWTSGIAPSNGSTVTISTADPHTVTYAGTNWIAGLTLGVDTIEIDAGTLALKGTSTIGGTVSGPGLLSIIGGTTTINGSGALAVADLTLWGAGTDLSVGKNLTYMGNLLDENGAAITLSGGYLVVTGAATLLNGSVNGSQRMYLENSAAIGTLTIGGGASVENTRTATQSGGTVTVGDSGSGTAVLINYTGATYAIADDSGLAHGAAAGSYLLNQGLFEKTGGTGTSIIAASIQDVGSIAAASGVLAFSGPSNFIGGAMTGAGTLAFSGGNTLIGSGATATVASLNVTGVGTHVTVGESLSYGGVLTQTNGSVISVAGGDTLTLTGSSMLQGGVNGAGTLALASGTHVIGAGAAFAVASLAVTGKATAVTVGTNEVYGGTFSAAAGTVVTLSGGYLLLTGATSFSGAALTGSQRLYAEGTTAIAGGLTIGGTVVFETVGATTQTAGDLTLGDSAGTAILFNYTGGTYAIGDNSNIVAAPGSPTSYVLNQGTFEKTAGTGTSTVSARFISTGSVAVASGTLALSGASNSFAGAIVGAGTVALTGGYTAFAAGASVSVASLTMSGSSVLAVSESTTYGGRLTEGVGSVLSIGSGDTLTLTGTCALDSAVVGAGALALTGGGTTTRGKGYGYAVSITAGSMTVTGSSVIIDGVVNATGSFSQDAGSTMTFGRGYFYASGQSTLSGTLNGSGSFYAAGPASIQGGLSVGLSTTIEVLGTATQSNGNLAVGYQLFIESSGTYALADDSDITISGPYGAGIYNHFGLLEKTGGSGTSTVACSISNYGVITVSSGTLDLQQAVQNPEVNYPAGALDIVGAATLQLDGEVYRQNVDFSGTGGTLVLNALAQFYNDQINGFHSSDAISVSSSYVFKGFVENSQNTAGTLTLTENGSDTAIVLNGTFAASGFASTTTGGHTVISYTAPSQQATVVPAHS